MSPERSPTRPPLKRGMCVFENCNEKGTIDVDTAFGSVYVCEAHFEEALP